MSGFRIDKNRFEEIKLRTIEILAATNNIQEITARFKLPEIPLEEKINQARLDLHRICLTKDFRLLFQELIAEIVSVLPANDFVISGFFWRVIRRWQESHQEPILVITQWPLAHQIKAGEEILRILRTLLARGIYLPDKKLKKQLLDGLFMKLSKLFAELLSAHDFLSNPMNHLYLEKNLDQSWR